jgi:hypothetical protein
MHKGVAHGNDSLKDEGMLGALEWTWEKVILTPPGTCTPIIVVPCGPTTRSMGVTVPHESLSDSFKTAVYVILCSFKVTEPRQKKLTR